jgi:hypothetical protein
MGIFGDVWSGIKSVGGAVNEGLKKTKILSKIAPIAGSFLGNPVAGAGVGTALGALGYRKGGMVVSTHKPIAMKKGGKVKPKPVKTKAKRQEKKEKKVNKKRQRKNK